MAMSDIWHDGEQLKFKREIPNGMKIDFDGQVGDASIEGKWISEMGDHECSGEKVASKPKEKVQTTQPDQK